MDDELDMEEREKTHTKYLNKIMDILENDRRAIIKETSPHEKYYNNHE